MNVFSQEGLEFRIESLRDFEDERFVEELLEIFCDTPLFLRPKRYGIEEPLREVVDPDQKAKMKNAFLASHTPLASPANKEGLLMLKCSSVGYMLQWVKRSPPIFQRLSGHASRKMLEKDEGRLEAFLQLFYRIAEHVCAVFGSVNSMMTKGGEIPYDLTVRLPNVPWLTLFGKPYIEFFGRDRILSAPFGNIEELPSGLIAAKLTSAPFDALTEAQRAPIREYLGSDCFMEGTRSLKLYSGGSSPDFDFTAVLPAARRQH